MEKIKHEQTDKNIINLINLLDKYRAENNGFYFSMVLARLENQYGLTLEEINEDA